MNINTLMIERLSSGIIPPNSNIRFENISNSLGKDLVYNNTSRSIIINKKGIYSIKWNVMINRGYTGYEEINFSLVISNGDEVQGEYQFKTSKVIGYYIMNVKSLPVSIMLKNTSDKLSVVLNSEAKIKVSLEIIDFTDLMVSKTSTDEGGGPIGPEPLISLNLLDGSAMGSIRGINTAKETGEVGTTMADNAVAFGESTKALGCNATVKGINSSAFGCPSHAEGYFSLANGISSHAEGEGSYVLGTSSHVEGLRTKAYSGNSSHAEGSESEAFGDSSHAEGHKTKAKPNYSHVEGNSCTSAEGTHVEGVFNNSKGEYSHVEGYKSNGEGYAFHVEGYINIANGIASHAEGGQVIATSSRSHAEGDRVKAIGIDSHAEGVKSEAGDYFSHSEGCLTVASSCCHAEGVESKATVYASHAEGHLTEANGQYCHTEGEQTIANGESAAHAEGHLTEANNQYCHAEGLESVAEGLYSHAEGDGTLAQGNYSHAKGYFSTASGSYSNAEGYNTVASASAAHAEGRETVANGAYSHAGGLGTKVDNIDGAYIIGKYGKPNAESVGNSILRSGFFLSNGRDDTTLSLAAEFMNNGDVYIDGNYIQNGADYAEMFESYDGKSIDVGYFVTFDNGEKIRKAKSTDNYILGVISSNASIIADTEEFKWKDKYLKDEWGRVKYDEESNPILNADWNNSYEYTGRLGREEWIAVGLLGKILVRDNGECKVGGYCRVSDEGIAIPSEEGYKSCKIVEGNMLKIKYSYRVLSRTGESQILIFFR